MNIVLGITGSIAAYKAADLASQLVKQGHTVHVVMTRAGTEFIAPLTLQTLTRNPVLVSLEDEKRSWKPGHIELADHADLFLVAPATANVIAEFANGLAMDSLTSIYLALPRTTPVLIAPSAMSRNSRPTAANSSTPPPATSPAATKASAASRPSRKSSPAFPPSFPANPDIGSALRVARALPRARLPKQFR